MFFQVEKIWDLVSCEFSTCLKFSILVFDLRSLVFDEFDICFRTTDTVKSRLNIEVDITKLIISSEANITELVNLIVKL